MIEQRRKRSAILLAAGLAALLTGAFASGCAVEESEKPPPLSVTEMVPVLTQPQEPSDVMPVAMQKNLTPETDTQSVRYLGNGGGTEYWVAQMKDTEGVCFFIADTGVSDSLAGGCIGARSFYDNGLTNSNDGRGGSLLSSDVDTTPLTRYLADGLTVVDGPESMSPERASSQKMTRLVAFDVDPPSSASLKLPRTSGEPVVFNL